MDLSPVIGKMGSGEDRHFYPHLCDSLGIIVVPWEDGEGAQDMLLWSLLSINDGQPQIAVSSWIKK